MLHWKTLVIILFFFIILSGCVFDQGKKTGLDNEKKIVCNPSYIRIGHECCLDKNSNRICDRDEDSMKKTTTTRLKTPSTVKTTTTLKASTTTHPNPTTTVKKIACHSKDDCGREKKYLKCYRGEVVTYYEIPQCDNPGRSYSRCISKTTTEPYKKCKSYEGCIQGECIEATLIKCVDACLEKGYSSNYCYHDNKCQKNDVKALLGDSECNPEYCCCEAASKIIVSKTVVPKTTIPPMTSTTILTTTTLPATTTTSIAATTTLAPTTTILSTTTTTTTTTITTTSTTITTTSTTTTTTSSTTTTTLDTCVDYDGGQDPDTNCYCI